MTFNRLYIHVPFCSSKCGYCAFYSEPNADKEMISSYLRHIEKEFSANSAKCSELDSVFIGGGTPTSLSSANLAKLFDLISANFAIPDNAEISIEANPESLDEEKVSIIANFANRVSLGIQSFNCEFRKTLERAGTADSVFKGIELIKDSEIRNIGCDLIYSIPGQTLDDWKNELKKAVDLGVKHISAYSLTYEEGTLLTENKERAEYFPPLHTPHPAPVRRSSKSEDGSRIPNPESPASDLEADMWELTGEFLKGEGISRYEVSNYAIPGFECRHNREIWYGDTYLGCGPAATSFDGKNRYSNPSDLQQWLNEIEPEKDIISTEKRASEILMMGLRTVAGWQVEKFEERSGLKIGNWQDEINNLECEGFVQITTDTIAPTEKGLIFWDEIAERVL